MKSNVLLYYVCMHFSVLIVLVFVCTVAMLFILSYKLEDWLAITPDLTHHFVLNLVANLILSFESITKVVYLKREVV